MNIFFINTITITNHFMKKIYSKLFIGFLFVMGIVGAEAQITVTGCTGAGNGSYATLGAAITAIGTVQPAANIAISVTASTTEAVGSITIGAGTWTTMTISPSGGAWTITAATTAGLPMIDFSGADNVTINGLNTGGNALNISNTTASATSITSTIRFIGGATNNTITNCSVQGSFSAAVGTNGGNIYFATDAVTANGNDNNTISNNNIGPAGANLPTKGIFMNGSTTTTAINNSGNTFNNNNIFDYFGAAVSSAGVYISTGNTDNNITNNKFYQTATRTQTTGAQHSAVWIANASGNNFQVTGNTIGYSSSTSTGTYTLVGVASTLFVPFFINVGSTTASSYQNNTITAIAMSGAQSGTTSTTSPLRFFYIADGLVNIGNVTGNTIGSLSATGAITYTSSSSSASSIYVAYNFGNFNFNFSSNNIGGVTVSNSSTGAANFYGVRVNTVSGVSFTCQNNTIGGTIANSINSTSTATGTIVNGILDESPAATVTGNTIRNMTVAGGTGTGSSASMIGISIVATSANHTVSQNTIHTLSNTSAAAAVQVSGINFSSSSGTNLIARNIIHSLSIASTSVTSVLNGINVIGGTATYQNNMIRLGIDASGGALTNGFVINGINETTAGTDNFYFNSVYIGGTGVGGSANTYAFQSTITTNTRIFRNNIFYNARSNAAGTGKHYAVRVGGTAPNPAGLTINNNIYLANGTGGVFGFFNSLDVADLNAWKTAVGQDAGSYSSDPQYLVPNGTSATVDLHINPSAATQVEGNAANIPAITDDYDGQIRASFTPEDIGADAGNFTAAGDINPPVITYTTLTGNCSTGDRALNGVTITDVSGVPTSGILQPRIYYRKGAGTWFSSQGILASGSGTNGVWNLTIVAADMGGVAGGNVISYYVIAQDIVATPNITSNPSAGLVATDVNTVTTHPTIPNNYTISNTLNGTYTVGGGGAYATITAAVTSYNNSCLSGPVTFSLLDAGYPSEIFPISININADANATNTLTIKPTQAGTTITGSNAAAIFVLNGADYVTIDGSTGSTANTVCPLSTASRNLTITNTNSGTSSAVVWMQTNVADGATNNTVKNCNLVGNSNTTTLFAAGSGSSTISTGTLGTGNNNNSFVNNNISKTQYGIYAQGASAANKNTGTVINQNLINTVSPNNVQIGGIYIGFDNGATISGNTVSGMASSSDAFGISTGVTSWVATTTTGNEVSNVTISKNALGLVQSTGTNSAAGILAGPSATGTNQVSNNMIYGVISNSTPGDLTAGIFSICGAGATQVYYNTVSMSGDRGAGTTGSSLALAVMGTDPIIDIRNNILINKQTTASTGKSYAIGLGYSTFVNLTSNNNDLFTSGANGNFAVTATLNAGTDRTSLALWQAATGKDAASINVDAVFNSATDLHLVTGSNPTINNAGATVSVTDDIDCTTRNATTPDIGADEFTPVTDDAGVTAIILPAPFCAGLQTVQATIKNFGAVTLNSVLVDWTVTPGGAQPQVNPAISLAPGASTTITLGSFTFATGTTYSITATTSLPNGNADGNTGNDAFTQGSINTGLSGNYNVGAGGDFATLTLAAAAYNTRNICGSVVFTLTDASYGSETFPITFNNNVYASAVNTLTIQPGTTVSLSGSNATSIISLNGGRYITIDGRIGGTGTTHSLTITNTLVTGPAVLFINDAGNNTVKYKDLKSDNTTTTSGVVLFSTTTGANGNDNNTIDNCNIGPNAANPTNGIYSSGTTTLAAQYNSGNTVSNCNIFDFFSATSDCNGVLLSSGSDTWTIQNNSFYQTASRTFTTSGSIYGGVQVNYSLGNNFLISGNYIGGGAALCAGSASTILGNGVLRAIRLTVGSTTATNVQGNTIQNISLTSSSTSTSQSAISLLTGNINLGTVTGNTIGSQSADATTSPSIDVSISGSAAIFSAILAGTGTPGVLNIANNTIGGIRIVNTGAPATGTSVRGIGVQGAPTSLTINNNTVGSTTTANSIVSSTTSSLLCIFLSTTIAGTNVTNNTVANLSQTGTGTTNQLVGMLLQGSSGGSFITTGNTVRNLSSTSTSILTGGSASIVGISHTAATTAGQTLSQNTVYSLSNTDATVASAVTGIHYAGPTTGTNVIARNLVYGLSISSTNAAAEIRGINFSSGLANVQNNMIRLGTTIANGNTIYGLFEVGSTATSGIYFNSVYIGGTGVGTQTGNSYAFRSSQTTNTRTFQNNIFFNARSNTSTGGKHYAVWVAGTAANPAGLTLNYNDYFVNGTGGVFGFFNSADVANLTAWRTAVGQDLNSLSGDPQYIDPTGATPNLHIHATNPTPIESAGLAIGTVTDDYDGQTRASFTPTDIGADAGDFVASDISGPVITYTLLTSTCATGDRILSGVTITDGSGVPTSGVLQPRIYYKKGAGSWFSSQGSLTGGSATNGTWSFTIIAADMGGLTGGDVISYYVIAQDIATTPNISSNPAAGLVATDVNTVTTHPTTPNSITILATLSGTYTVGGGGAYPTLTAAVASYNSSCLGGAVVFELINATYPSETFPITINANANAGAVNTLTIRPAAGMASTISGSTSTILKLNGADYVTIDGLNTGGSSLTLSNTNTVTGTTVLFVASLGAAAGATNDAIKNCTIQNGTVGAAAVTNFGIFAGNTSGAANGEDNDNLTIQNNTIRKTTIGIQAIGGATAGQQNDNLLIDNNIIGDAVVANSIGRYGMNVGQATNATVSKNSISNVVTTDAAITSNNNATGLIISTGTTSSTFTANNITGVRYTGATGYGGKGIDINTGNAASNLTISNNFVSDIKGDGWSDATSDGICGIRILGTTGGVNLYYNSVNLGSGSFAGNTSGTQSGALVIGSTATALNIRNNIFATNLVNSNAASAKSYSILSKTTSNSVFTSIDYNDYYPSGTQGLVGQLNSIDAATLVLWKTASGQDLNSINVQPNFTSATNLHLITNTNCGLDGKGIAIGGITTDLDADTRGTPPDIGADEFTSTFSASAGSTQFVCGTSATLAATLSNGTGTWTPGFGGYTPNNTTATAVVSGLTSSNAGTTNTLTWTITNAGSCNSPYNVDVIAFSPATVNANSDAVVCASSPDVILNGIIGGSATSATWSGGAGTFAPNNTTLGATYTPTAGEITAGTVTLTLTTDDPAGPCASVNDAMTITINPAATANANSDQSVCESSPDVTLNGIIGGSATSATWTGGTGTFNPDNTTLNAVYTPSAAEISAGGVTLTLETDDPTGPCGSGTDDMVINIYPAATADAGSAQIICAGNTVSLSGSFGGGATSASWSGGAGVFTPNATSLNTVYTPTAGEITAGTVTLTLTTDDPTGPCNAATGNVIITISAASGSVVSVNSCKNMNVGTGATYTDGSCNVIAKVEPTGATPVSGMINTCATIDPVQMYYNSAPYVQRHMDIEPATNAATATATVTLYFNDAEFSTYNSNNPTYPQLPTVAGGGSTDPNRANLKVTQYHGTATTSPSAPGFYTGTAQYIDPVDADISYNGSYWEVKVNVNGFSGFYVYTSFSAGPLPITINYFNGTKQGGNHLLNWKVTCNSTPKATMILERSADSRNFHVINTVVADAARCNQPFDYTDAQPLPGMNYYRLKMVDADGKISYSGIVALLNAVKGFDIISIAPNPVVTGNFKLNVSSAQSSKMEITIIDMQGRLVNTQTVSVIAGFNSITMEVGNLAAGSYTIQGIIGGDRSRIIRFVKQ
jgi:hypothetical protein